MGIRYTQARSTLADALNLRDWRIYQTLAVRLIERARGLLCQKIDLELWMIRPV